MRFPQQPPACSQWRISPEGEVEPTALTPGATAHLLTGFINAEALGTLTLTLKSLISHRVHAGPYYVSWNKHLFKLQPLSELVCGH